MRRISSISVSTIIVFILICIGISSCSKSNHVVSSNFIQKRKYTSGFFVNKHPNNFKSSDKYENITIENTILNSDSTSNEAFTNKHPQEEITHNQPTEFNKDIPQKGISIIEHKKEVNINKRISFKSATGIAIARKSIAKRIRLHFELSNIEISDPAKKGWLFLGIGVGSLLIGLLLMSAFAMGPGANDVLGFLGFGLFVLGAISMIIGLVFLIKSLFA